MVDTRSDVQSDMERRHAIQGELMARAFAEPELSAARATACPQEMYVRLAQRCPVRELGDNMYSLLRMSDILYVTKHHAVEQGSKYLGSDRPAIPLGLDGPDHRKYRRLLDPVFAPKRMAPLAASVRALANEMIDTFIDRGSVDAYVEWCEPLPSRIFLSIMGLPMDDLSQFLLFKSLILNNEVLEALPAKERTARSMEAVTWIHNYFDADLDAREREAQPRDDIIGWLFTTEVDGQRLSRQEIMDILGLLMIAGLDTVAASLACFLSYFARNPADRQRILDRPELIPSAVEELMRFESPVTEGFREVHEDLLLPSGYRIPAGSHLFISWSAANLDAERFPDPLQVDLGRTANGHIGFASGYHRCLGSHLARMEMQTALAVWHERIPHYVVKDDQPLVYSGNPRAPHHLWLSWR